jgi:DMSO/TMAO reductase YedYZ molybdopterin-dependent catalytic subunit
MSKLKDLKVPVFWAEGHPGRLDREGWRIEVTGLCRKPHAFTWQELVGMPKTVADARLTSVTRFSVRGEWGGVRVSDILETVEADASAKFVRFWSVGKTYHTSVSMEIARRERMLLAYEFDGEYLDEDYGGPVRALCPYLWGYKSAKSVVTVELMDHYVAGFWERLGYPDDAEIEAGKVRDMNSGGRLRPIPAGEVIHFLDE